MKSRFAVAILALFLILTEAAWAQHASLLFIDDDYSAALAQARQRSLPLFVEVWAPW